MPEILAIKVGPKASRNQVVGWEGDELKVRIAAAPEKGAANEELVRYLAKLFSIAPSHLTIISGETSRHKRIRITGIEKEAMLALLPPK